MSPSKHTEPPSPEVSGFVAGLILLMIGVLGGAVVLAQDDQPQTWPDSISGLPGVARSASAAKVTCAGRARAGSYAVQLATRTVLWDGILVGCSDSWMSTVEAAQVADLVSCHLSCSVTTIDDQAELDALRAAVHGLRRTVDQELATYVQTVAATADAQAAEGVPLPAGW